MKKTLLTILIIGMLSSYSFSQIIVEQYDAIGNLKIANNTLSIDEDFTPIHINVTTKRSFTTVDTFYYEMVIQESFDLWLIGGTTGKITITDVPTGNPTYNPAFFTYFYNYVENGYYIFRFDQPNNNGWTIYQKCVLKIPINTTFPDFVAINDVHFDNFSIYPNPTNSLFTISNALHEANLFITDLAGKIIYQSVISGEEKIDVSNFTNGVYFVNVEYQGNRSVEKLVVGK